MELLSKLMKLKNKSRKQIFQAFDFLRLYEKAKSRHHKCRQTSDNESTWTFNGEREINED